MKRDFDEFMGNETKDENMDRISQLPASILHDILFYLPLKDEARTCVLSKSWNTHVWNSLQQRSFDFTQVPNPIARYECFYSEEGQQDFINRVDESFKKLQTERFKLATFSITFNLLEENYVFCLDRWLELAAQSNLRSLSVEVVCTGIEFIWYKFPKISLSSIPLLKELKLTSCTLQQESLCVDNAAPFALQRLCLAKVIVENQDGVFQNFISKCTSLEYLSIYDFVGLKDLRLSNHPKLKELDVEVVRAKGFVLLERVEVVDCPSLETVRASCCYGYPMVVKFTRCRNLKHLYLEDTTKVEEDFFQNLATNFPLLQTLSFHDCFRGDACVVRHPLIKTFRLVSSELTNLTIETPNLLSFVYEGTIIPRTILFLATAPSCFLDIQFGSRGTLRTQGGLNQCRAFLAQLHKRNVNVGVDIDTLARVFTNVDIFRGRSTLDLICEVEILKIHFRRSVECVVALVFNGLLWCCRPKKLLVIQNNLPETMGLPKAIREIVMSSREDDHGCCNAHPVRCWRHYLKVISINDIDTANNALLEPLLQNISSYKEIMLTLSWF